MHILLRLRSMKQAEGERSEIPPTKTKKISASFAPPTRFFTTPHFAAPRALLLFVFSRRLFSVLSAETKSAFLRDRQTAERPRISCDTKRKEEGKEERKLAESPLSTFPAFL